MSALGIIGGTGLNELQGLEVVAEHRPDTPYGEPSGSILEGEYNQQQLFFLARHGTPHRIPPHRINYRGECVELESPRSDRGAGSERCGGNPARDEAR